MDLANMSPKEVRALIREQKITSPTAGMCAGYAQGNLVVLPKDLAYDFLLFTQRNPKSCPIRAAVISVRLRTARISRKIFRNTGSTVTECWTESIRMFPNSGRMIL